MWVATGIGSTLLSYLTYNIEIRHNQTPIHKSINAIMNRTLNKQSKCSFTLIMNENSFLFRTNWASLMPYFGENKYFVENKFHDG